MLNMGGSNLLLWFGAGRTLVVFSIPERTPPDEFLVGLSLLHFVVKGVQSIERYGCVWGKECALGLMDKDVRLLQHRVAVDGTDLLERLSREYHVLKPVCDHFPLSTPKRWR